MASAIARLWAKLILDGEKSIDDVPKMLKKSVEELLKGECF